MGNSEKDAFGLDKKIFRHVAVDTGRKISPPETYQHLRQQPEKGDIKFYDNRREDILGKYPGIKKGPSESADVSLYFDPKMLFAPKLDKVVDIPYKNSAILVAPSLYRNQKEDFEVLSLIVNAVSKVLDTNSCDYDITEENLKIKGVCRLTDKNEAFTSFSIRIFHSFIKGSAERRYVVVAHKLSGDSSVWYPVFSKLKSALMMKGVDTSSKVDCTSSRLLNSTDGTNEAVEKSVNYFTTVLESGYFDQKIQAAKALAHLVSSNNLARRLVINNSRLMNSLKDVFDSGDELFRKPSDDHYLYCELQLFTTSIWAELSKDKDTEISRSLIEHGVLSKCFNSIKLLCEHEEKLRNPEEGKSLVKRHNIKFWYRQSKRETARCLANIATKSSVETAAALQSEGLGWFDNSCYI